MSGAVLTIPSYLRLRSLCVGVLLLSAFVSRSPCQDEPAEDSETKEPVEATAPLKEDDDGYAQVELLLRAMEIVREHYVDESKVSYESLVNNALAGMLSALDPHSQFLYPALYEQVKETLDDGTYDGVGIAVAPKNGALSIVSVREDGPAARAGVLPGDQIVQIGNRLAKDLPIVEAVQMLRGNPGESMKLILKRPTTDELRSVEILREVIKEDTVKDVMLIDESMTGTRKIGYARLLQFNEPSAGELRDALDRLEDDGMEAFVLDLRNNPGGLITSAVDVCGEFVPPETSIVTTEGRVRAHDQPPYLTASRKQRERTYPMAVLVNHSSASGSELVAGALQDLKRAVIVGETTFGKGSVQGIIPMQQGTALRLTIAKYYTPDKWTIHERGVTPDIVATLTPEQEERVFKWWAAPDRRAADGVKSLADLGDRQLQRAVDALQGVLVLQGRGADKK
ncbi:MAG: S41 family peptidase [Verrucomicrobia bacterium]|nr:S41 family peptidase [Verrucomicrobiota bacterium]